MYKAPVNCKAIDIHLWKTHLKESAGDYNLTDFT